MITLDQFRPYLDADKLDALMIETSEAAMVDPQVFYLFLQRFVSYNGTYSALVPELCNKIGTSGFFVEPNSRFAQHSNRAMDVAAKVFAASIEEFGDPRIQVSHRTLAYALLDAVAEFAGLSDADIERIAYAGEWVESVKNQVRAGYAAESDNLQSLVKAMGFHAAAETIGGHEFSIVHRAVFGEKPYSDFIKYMKSHKVSFEHGMVSPWYWIVIHGRDMQGLETIHSEEALIGLRRVVQYTNVPEAQVIEWAGEGFRQLYDAQVRLFELVQGEIRTLTAQRLVAA
jgi:hypothetical protein